MSRLVIVGAGAFGRELYGWVSRSPGYLRPGETTVFISDDLNSLAAYPRFDGLLLGSLSGYAPLEDDRVLLAIGAPAGKRAVVKTLREKGATFASFVHSSVIVSDDAAIGEGAVLCPNVVVSCNASIGSFVSVNLAATIGHDAAIGEFCSLMSHVDITGGVKLEAGVFVGSHACVLPGVSVGEDAVIGAGSAVIRRVSAGTTVAGVPAQRFFGSRPKS